MKYNEFKIILLSFIHVHVCITVVEIAGHNPHNTAGYVNFFATIAIIIYRTKQKHFFSLPTYFLKQN